MNMDYMSEDTINPFNILNISTDATYPEYKKAYMNLATNRDRDIRRNACLAYDALCNRDKYIRRGNLFTVKNKDCFYYTIDGDLKSLKHDIKMNKNLLLQKDGFQRSLLYLAARNGYFNLTEYLIKKGININEVQRDGSTALHGAAYYGQELVIQLLIENGIDTKVVNNFGHTAAQEAKTTRIRELILNSERDIIMELFHKLYKQNLVSNIVPIKKNDEIIAQKLICSKSILPSNWSEIKKNWIPAWHGTKFQFLESIVKNGLKPSGTKLDDGTTINPLPGHISLTATVSGIKNWAKAIFVSPSLFYSSDVVYAERINSMKGTEDSSSNRWACLVEVRLRPNCYSKHNSTVVNYNSLPGEPNTVEYRVQVKSDDDLIYRVASGGNVVVTSITFVLVKFLENVSNYCEGDIMINSKEERMLLEL
jgi:ankyrin repeat protein